MIFRYLKPDTSGVHTSLCAQTSNLGGDLCAAGVGFFEAGGVLALFVLGVYREFSCVMGKEIVGKGLPVRDDDARLVAAYKGVSSLVVSNRIHGAQGGGFVSRYFCEGSCPYGALLVGVCCDFLHICQQLHIAALQDFMKARAPGKIKHKLQRSDNRYHSGNVSGVLGVCCGGLKHGAGAAQHNCEIKEPVPVVHKSPSGNMILRVAHGGMTQRKGLLFNIFAHGYFPSSSLLSSVGAGRLLIGLFSIAIPTVLVTAPIITPATPSTEPGVTVVGLFAGFLSFGSLAISIISIWLFHLGVMDSRALFRARGNHCSNDCNIDNYFVKSMEMLSRNSVLPDEDVAGISFSRGIAS